MSKDSSVFTCSNCGAQFQKWIGRCLECGKWGTVDKEPFPINPKETKAAVEPGQVVKLNELNDNLDISRLKTGISELDRVLGGGFVPGSMVLLGGEPGIGKSTLSLQISAAFNDVIYFSGEESTTQVAMRAERLGLKNKPIKLSNETIVEKQVARIIQDKPNLAIIDSIQTVNTKETAGEPGNPNQIRAGAAQLLGAAKSGRTAIMVIGHVTKDGTVAGPRLLEHIVDTVLYFEGDPQRNLRLLRAYKNRFGSTDEVGLFEMNEEGLKAVNNPSEYLLSERGENMPGSVITCLLEGARPILVEVQALLNKTSFGYPVRKASGFDLNRLHVLIAVLQKHAHLNLTQYDVHLNVVGGLKANEPAADLAVCLAIASAFKDKSLGKDLVAFGEIGLGGEVRSVRMSGKRIKEAQNLGMKRVVIRQAKKDSQIKLIEVKNISELIQKT